LNKDKFGLEKSYRILKIKNPKVQNWKGEWSTESELWTDEIKEYVNFNSDDKGELYITFEDFWSFFYKTTIWFYRPKMKYNYLVLSHEIGSSCLVSFSVKKEADIHFKIVQIQRCLFPRSLRYKIARTHFMVGKLLKGKEKVKFVCANYSNIDQNVSIKPKGTFKPGEYWAYIQCDWNHPNINQFVFSILCEEEIKYEVIDNPGNFFLRDCLKSYAKNNIKKFRSPKKGRGMEIKHETGNNTAGFGFYYYENNNESGARLFEKIKFTKAQGIEFLYNQPKDDYYIVDIPPGKSEILITKKVAKLTKVKFTHVTIAKKD
jgi:hypothetical protein